MSKQHLFVEHFFATPIFYGAILDEKFHSELINLYKDCDEKGWFKQEWGEDQWEGQYSKKQSERDNDTTASTIYFQPRQNILEDNEFLENTILRYAHGYLDNIETPERNLNIHSSWMHKAKHKDAVGWHHHGYKENRISGVYYIKANDVVNGGRTLFKSPNPYTGDFTAFSARAYKPQVDFQPVERNMLMWPSSIDHRTTPNWTKNPRIIMSFNIDIDYQDDDYHHEV